MRPASPYLTTADAAAYLQFHTVGAFRTFLWRRRKAGSPIRTYRRTGKLLFKVSDLDAALDEERPLALARRAS